MFKGILRNARGNVSDPITGQATAESSTPQFSRHVTAGLNALAGLSKRLKKMATQKAGSQVQTGSDSMNLRNTETGVRGSYDILQSTLPPLHFDEIFSMRVISDNCSNIKDIADSGFYAAQCRESEEDIVCQNAPPSLEQQLMHWKQRKIDLKRCQIDLEQHQIDLKNAEFIWRQAIIRAEQLMQDFDRRPAPSSHSTHL